MIPPKNVDYNLDFTVLTFYHPMNLHYSQTDYVLGMAKGMFYHPMNLHYSQTSNSVFDSVPLPYG